MIRVSLLALALSAVEGFAGPTQQLDAILERMGQGSSPEEIAVNARFEPGLKAAPVRVDAGRKTAAGGKQQAGGALAQKAAYFDKVTAEEHRPFNGLILSRRLNPDGSLRQYDNYGDSLIWTGNYIAAQAYRYAVTQDEEALRRMEESLWGVHANHEATGNPGHVARVLVPRAYADSIGFKPEDKPDNKRHYAKGKWEGWTWEGDNSFDSYDGYLFGIAASWPYIRDPKLREAIKDDMLQLGLHVIRNDMRIVGEDTFLDFRANYFYQDRWPKWMRGLPMPPWRDGNSVHGLHTMGVAAYVTQDPRLKAYYRQKMLLEEELDLKVKDAPQLTNLIDKHAGLLTRVARTWSGDKTVVAHRQSLRSDIGNNLQHMALYDVIRLETDPEVRRNLIEAFKQTHADVAQDANTYWDYLYASQVGAPPETLAKSAETLRRFPDRKPRGPVKNSDDPAYAKSRYFGLHGDTLFPARWYNKEPLPFDKRALPAAFVWQHNPYELDGGDGSDDQGSGTDYLIAYWLGRYHGFIGPEE